MVSSGSLRGGVGEPLQRTLNVRQVFLELVQVSVVVQAKAVAGHLKVIDLVLQPPDCDQGSG
jgi:hypothetical protein